jgi:peptidoglycan biosynthesis protein MviN/MurJ (putative lipid II flippase)
MTSGDGPIEAFRQPREQVQEQPVASEAPMSGAAIPSRSGALFLKGTAVFASGTALTLVLGAARDLWLARTLGAGAVADLVLLATGLPVAIAASCTATLDSVILPSLTKATAPRARVTLARVERGLSWLMLWCAPVLLAVLLRPAMRAATGAGLWNVAAVLPMSVGLYIAAGVLTFRQRCRLGRALRFFAAGAVPGMITIGTIAGVALMTLLGAPWWPVLGALLGAVAAVKFSGLGAELPWGRSRAENGGRRSFRTAWLYVRQSMPVSLGAIFFALANTLIRVAASIGPVGAVASLEYATRAFNIPSTLLTTSAAAVFLPLRVAEVGPERNSDLVVHAWWSVLFMSPLACALAASGPVIARVLLGPGHDETAARAITLNTVGLAAGLPLMLLANIRLRSDQAARRYRTQFLGGLAFLLAAAGLAAVLAITRAWALFGFAHTSGLASLGAVIAAAGENRMPSFRAQVIFAVALAAGLVASLTGAMLAGALVSALLVVSVGVVVSGWLIGLGCVSASHHATTEAGPRHVGTP